MSLEIQESDEDSEPQKKKLKSNRSETETSASLARIVKKVVADTNQVLGLTDFEERINASHVKAAIDDNENFAVSVLCLLCNPTKYCKLSGTKYSVDVASYKRHLSLVHLEKGSKLVKGVKIKNTKSQPLLTAYMEPVRKSGPPQVNIDLTSAENPIENLPENEKGGHISKK